MIPLKTPAKLEKVPVYLLGFCALSFFSTLFFSKKVWTSQMGQILEFLLGGLVFPSLFLAVICLWYSWIFLPVVLTRKAASRGVSVASILSVVLLTWLGLRLGHSVPMLFVAANYFFGFAMRDQIWGNVDTLVIGPRLFSVFEVPCYVHVFFFFFYLMLSTLISPLSNFYGKPFYFLALVSFIVGFLMRLFEYKVLKDDPTLL